MFSKLLSLFRLWTSPSILLLYCVTVILFYRFLVLAVNFTFPSRSSKKRTQISLILCLRHYLPSKTIFRNLERNCSTTSQLVAVVFVRQENLYPLIPKKEIRHNTYSCSRHEVEIEFYLCHTILFIKYCILLYRVSY